MSDLIKREDAIASIKPMVGEFTDNGFMVDYERVLSILEEIPSADTPQGEWIHDYHFGLALPEHKCSVCGEWEYSDTESNFCPHCGCRMKGTDDDTD